MKTSNAEMTTPIAQGPVDVEVRTAFEAWISAPPFEHMCDRNGEDSAWPGTYKRYETELAWEAWQAAAAVEREACAKGARRSMAINMHERLFEHYAYTLERLAEESETDDPEVRARLLKTCAAGMREAMAYVIDAARYRWLRQHDAGKLRGIVQPLAYLLSLEGTGYALKVSHSEIQAVLDEEIDNAMGLTHNVESNRTARSGGPG